tara:strand:- start:1324 stop:1542 length:219 start_codon:yes stop_codon:yes gene_type:complete
MLVGDLVKWYEMYGDIHIVRDTGLGSIVNISEYNWASNSFKVYEVYRFDHNDFVKFEGMYLEAVSKGDQNES